MPDQNKAFDSQFFPPLLNRLNKVISSLFIGKIFLKHSLGRMANSQRINRMHSVIVFEFFKKSYKSHTRSSKSMKKYHVGQTAVLIISVNLMYMINLVYTYGPEIYLGFKLQSRKLEGLFDCLYSFLLVNHFFFK